VLYLIPDARVKILNDIRHAINVSENDNNCQAFIMMTDLLGLTVSDPKAPSLRVSK
jgi:hypothetical protein